MKKIYLERQIAMASLNKQYFKLFILKIRKKVFEWLDK